MSCDGCKQAARGTGCADTGSGEKNPDTADLHPGIGEKLFRRMLRAAAWVAVAGVALGAGIEWAAILSACYAANDAQRDRLLSGALGAAVFWAMLWIGLPVGAVAFWRHIAWAERIAAFLLPAVMAAGAVVAWLAKYPVQ